MEKLIVKLTFLNPFRIVPWENESDRKTSRKYKRAGTYAKWHKINGNIGRPYITGTLVRSALFSEIEKILVLHGNPFKCCFGRDETQETYEKDGRQIKIPKPHFLKKRSQHISDQGSGTAGKPPAYCGNCLMCHTLGRGDEKRRDMKNPKQLSDWTVNFSNFFADSLKESDRREFDMRTEATARIANRVDPEEGKAKDYMMVWEIDPSVCSEFYGEIAINPKRMENGDPEKLKALIAAGLAQTNVLAGSICRMRLVENHEIWIGKFLEYVSAKTESASRPNQVKPSPDHWIQLANVSGIARHIAEISGAEPPELRRLADAVRQLRQYGPNILDRLPEGKEGRKSIWDRAPRTGPETLRIYLKNAAVSVTADIWRQFCEDLGRALYDVHWSKENKTTALPRLMGETEYHGLPMQNEAERQTVPIKTIPEFKWTIAGNLRAETPFFFGTAAMEGQTGATILLDRQGRFRLPRTVVRGALRRDLRQAIGAGCDMPVGGKPCECDVCRIMRRVVIEDAISPCGKPPDIRYRIRLNPDTGTVAEGALFDAEVGYQGMAFPFRLHFESTTPLLNSCLAAVLNHWKNGEAVFGGDTGTGLGRFALEQIRWACIDLKEEHGAYLLAGGFKGLDDQTIEKSDFRQIQWPAMTMQTEFPWKRIDYEIRITSPLISRDALASFLNERNVDTVSIKKCVYIPDGSGGTLPEPEERYFVKGESVRGVLRSILARKEQTWKPDHDECDCLQCRIFGNTHRQGKLRFEDAEIHDAANEKKMDHVAIDRFTGGGVDRLKFDDWPLMGSPEKPIVLKGSFWVHRDLDDKAVAAFRKALAEFNGGSAVLGGLGAIGYGWVPKGGLVIKDDEWNDAVAEISVPEKDIPNDGQTDFPEPFGKPVEKPEFETDACCHPHYFLRPLEAEVERESDTVSHAAKDDELLSGTIRCKLTTEGPIFIPDSDNDDWFGMKAEHPEHKNFGFFRIDEKPAIPGSSIRGVVSSVYEALTHSCFRIMDTQKYLTRRLRPESEGTKKKGRGQTEESGNGFLPGRARKDETEGKWVVEPMGESVRLPLYDDNKAFKEHVDMTEYQEKYGSQYETKLKNAKEYNQLLADAAKENRAFLKQLPKEQLEAILSGREIVRFKTLKQEKTLRNGSTREVNPNARYAVLTSASKTRGYIKYTGPDMVNVSKEPKTRKEFDGKWRVFDMNALPLHNAMEARPSQTKEYPRPVLACVKDNVEYRMFKRCERIFTEKVGGGARYDLPESVINQYNDILQDNKNNTEQIPDVFKNVMAGSKLECGDLVYFKADDASGRITALAPVCISREVDDKPMGKRFPEISINGKPAPNDSLRPCAHVCLENCDECPDLCARVKDYFHPHPKGLCPACHLFGTTHYRGRVRFGMAWLENEPQWHGKDGNKNSKGGPLTLPLLERPRPTWVMPEKKSEIPGRKFYVHHPGSVERLASDKTVAKGKNNRTVEPLGKGNTFVFEIRFHNLRKWELGLLLYALELEPGMAHKLGMGKAVGLGSVTVLAESVTVRQTNLETGKELLKSEGLKHLTDEIWAKAKESEKKRYAEDVKALLRLTPETETPTVRYPELERKNGEGPPSYVELGDKKSPHWLEPEKRRKLLQTPWMAWYSPKKGGRN